MAGSPIVFRTDQGASGASNTAKTAVDIVALLAHGACGPGYLGRPYAPSHIRHGRGLRDALSILARRIGPGATQHIAGGDEGPPRRACPGIAPARLRGNEHSGGFLPTLYRVSNYGTE